MKHGVILSICIPTFNRGDFLKQSLAVLLPQLVAYSDVVELLISDNCSTDNTQTIVEDITRNTSVPIEYSKNEENIGGNNNIARVVEKSQGKYVYVMGDDDILSPDFMRIIMPILQSQNELSIIHWNRLSGDKDCCNNQIIDNHYSVPSAKLNVSEFIVQIQSKASLISSVIFNRKCWDLGAEYAKDDYFGYVWYGRILWGAVLSGMECVYYYFPLIIQRNPSKSWIKFWPQYHISSMSNIFRDLESQIPGIYGLWSKQLRKSVKKTLPLIMRNKEYYWNKEVRCAMAAHLTPIERVRMYFYLCLPFGYTMYRVKGKALSIMVKILENWK